MSELRKRITHNGKLRTFEILGFLRGEQKGKTMNVDPYALMEGVRKQMLDLEARWATYYVTIMPSLKEKHLEEVEKAIADLRNNAGCLFLKLEEEVKKNGT